MKREGFDLEKLAMHVMQERGLEPAFSDEVFIELSQIKSPATPLATSEDLRQLLFCSIDNDDSLDLDQLTYAQKGADGKTTIWVAIADVSALVIRDSPIDRHAQINTTSVYTPAKIFPMLPEKLSTGLTSLNLNENRTAFVVQAVVNAEGEVETGRIFEGFVRNRAKLAYPSLGAWLAGRGKIPEAVTQVPGLEEALICQHEVAQALKQRRHSYGALTLESPEVEAKMAADERVILNPPSHNLADQLIEHFMIAANHVMARQLRSLQVPSLRRVVRVPKRWDRIVQVAASLREHLPKEPDARALEAFLIRRKVADPTAFPDLSLTIIKLLGRGEYIVEKGGDAPTGHFGLALREYIHSTAPNRRFPDLITQRQYRALLRGEKNPYPLEDLELLAAHCTHQEDAATKVERHLSKSAAALLLLPNVGSVYKGIITGSGDKGTWVRIFDPPVEGKVLEGFKGLDVGDRVSVKLVSVDVPKGYINFVA